MTGRELAIRSSATVASGVVGFLGFHAFLEGATSSADELNPRVQACADTLGPAGVRAETIPAACKDGGFTESFPAWLDDDGIEHYYLPSASEFDNTRHKTAAVQASDEQFINYASLITSGVIGGIVLLCVSQRPSQLKTRYPNLY